MILELLLTILVVICAWAVIDVSYTVLFKEDK